MNASATRHVVPQPAGYRLAIVSQARDNGARYELSPDDVLMVELYDVPEASLEERWQIASLPEGVLLALELYVDDGSWRKDGSRRSGREGEPCMHRFFLWCTDRGVPEGVAVFERGSDRFRIAIAREALTGPGEPTVDELMRRFRDQADVPLTLELDDDGRLHGRWSRWQSTATKNKQRRVAAGTVAGVLCGALYVERELQALERPW